MPITDPSILLGKKSDQLPRSSYEGRVGAAVMEGEYFATTSNMDVIYAPPAIKKMTYKMNYRLGEDDPLQWPQFYLDSAPYFSCIPRAPRTLSEESSTYIMFHRITDSDYEHQHDQSLTGLGHLKKSLLIKAHKFVHEAVNDRYGRGKNGPPIFTQLHSSILRSLNFLESLPMTRRQVLFIFADFQRHLLEFVAAFNYVKMYQPIMDGHGEPATVVDDVIGTFTTDVALADKFVRAGIPVWIIRPASLAGSVRIDALVEPLQSKDFLCLESAYHIYPISYIGSPLEWKKYTTFGRYSRDFLSYGNIYDVASLQPSDRLVATAKKARFQPYKPPKNPASGGRNKFLDVIHPFLPPMHDIWSTALLLVNQSRTFATQLGYAFPEPVLFVAVGSDDRRALYFHNWLKYRTILIFRMMKVPYPLRGQQWRDLLSLPVTTTIASAQSASSSATPVATTKTAKQRQLMKDMLQACLSTDPDLAMNPESSEKAVWRGQAVKPDEVPPESVARQILWELSELNFRYELHVLDGHLHDESPSETTRDVLISRCFPGNSMLLVDIENSDRGLASKDWKERRPYLLALRDIMKTWPGWSFKGEVNPESEESMVALETIVAGLYTQKFFDAFGRAPSIPRCI